MTWEIFLGIVVLVSFLVTVGKIVASLIKALTELTMTVKELSAKFDESEKKKDESHKKIWSHEGIQDKWLRNHENRLHDLDGKHFEGE